ncbi:hypothetical protein LQ50_17380 [Halalkalibacter okhensis]|uniref:Uncharacterized protein n=1 Tax=Halalkalibacter okhensis TaxID=333138 RepID=A0A0B0IDW9_9BACI|nr:hypothetical protein LQ50_17380 [Halalkalibacter okhensis]
MFENNQLNEAFLNCPYEYYDHEFRRVAVDFNWKQVVQSTVNNIVRAYVETPLLMRSNVDTLQLISKHWTKIDRNLFYSVQQFLSISAIVIDHLLSFLSMNKQSFDSNHGFLEDGASGIVTTLKGKDRHEAIVLEKLLLEVDEPLLQTYYDVAKRYYYEKNGSLPHQIEVIDLLNAKRYVHFSNLEEEQQHFLTTT